MQEENELTSREKALVSAYRVIEDVQERLQAVSGRKPKVPKLDAAERSEVFLVKGCSTPVWVKGVNEEGRVFLQMDAGGGLVYSLVGIVCDLCNGVRREEILAWEPSWISELRLQSYISATRQGGLRGVLEKIRSIAQEEY